MTNWVTNKAPEHFTLCNNDIPFMANGSFRLLSAVFNRLNGASEEGPASQRAYRASLNERMSNKLGEGDVITLKHHGHTVAEYVVGGPIGERLEESEAVDRFETRVCSMTGEERAQRGSAKRGALLAKFRSGATHEEVAAEAASRGDAKKRDLAAA